MDPALLLKPQQRGVHGAFVQLQHLFADLLDAPRNPKSVLWAESVESLQNHQIERALQDFGFVSGHGYSLGHCKEANISPLQCPQEGSGDRPGRSLASNLGSGRTSNENALAEDTWTDQTAF